MFQGKRRLAFIITYVCSLLKALPRIPANSTKKHRTVCAICHTAQCDSRNIRLCYTAFWGFFVFQNSASSYDRLRRRLVSSKNRRLVPSKNRRLVPSKNLRLVSIMEEPRTRGAFACSPEIPLGKPRAFSTVIPRRDEHRSSALIEDNTENTVCLQRKGLHKSRLPCVKGAVERMRD